MRLCPMDTMWTCLTDYGDVLAGYVPGGRLNRISHCSNRWVWSAKTSWPRTSPCERASG
jgi:hypothetical protein